MPLRIRSTLTNQPEMYENGESNVPVFEMGWIGPIGRSRWPMFDPVFEDMKWPINGNESDGASSTQL
jgi:hypothetical protein